jgi:hypothetical protein
MQEPGQMHQVRHDDADALAAARAAHQANVAIVGVTERTALPVKTLAEEDPAPEIRLGEPKPFNRRAGRHPARGAERKAGA